MLKHPRASRKRVLKLLSCMENSSTVLNKLSQDTTVSAKKISSMEPLLRIDLKQRQNRVKEVYMWRILTWPHRALSARMT